MKNLNEIVKTVSETAKKFDLNFTETSVHELDGDYEITIDIRIKKYMGNPYNLVNTIPQPNFNDILPKGDKAPL